MVEELTPFLWLIFKFFNSSIGCVILISRFRMHIDTGEIKEYFRFNSDLLLVIIIQ